MRSSSRAVAGPAGVQVGPPDVQVGLRAGLTAPVGRGVSRAPPNV
jgi:hypothetical protein